MQTTSLHSLLDFLRTRGFELGVDDYIAVSDLQLALQREKFDRERWRSLIGPLVCKNARQQEEFQQLFEQWTRQADAGKGLATDIIGRKPPIPVALSLKWVWWGIGGLLLGLFALIAWRNTDRTGNAGRLISGAVVNQQQAPLSGAHLLAAGDSVRSDSAGLFSLVYRGSADSLLLAFTIEKYHRLDTLIALRADGRSDLVISLKALSDSTAANRPPVAQLNQAEQIGQHIRLAKLSRLVEAYNQLTARELPATTVDPWQQRLYNYAPWIKIAGVIAPLMLFLVWWLPRHFRRRLVLRRLSTESAVASKDIFVDDSLDGDQLFSGYQLIFRELRRFRSEESTMLDIAASVEATATAAGRFTPVFSTRRRQPEYLILVDKQSFQDHQARLVFELVAQMQKSAIAVVCYSFNGDPRKLYDPFEAGDVRSLFEITSIYQHYHLLIFGDGSGCFEVLSGRLENWTEIFKTWKDAALFTPENTWSYKAMQLQELGLQVFPWLKTGMAHLIAVLNEERAPEEVLFAAGHNFPPLLTARSHRWLQHQIPSESISAKLMRQLEAYLDPTAMNWLRAIAVYPAVNWSISQFLGHSLQTDSGKSFFTEERLVKLSRLPWLRQGIMPDWFRLLLLRDMPASLDRQVRNLLRELLASAAQNTRSGFQLTLATDQAQLTDVGEWINVLPDDHRLKDAVFLDFMGGSAAKKLDVDLPGPLRKFLFHSGHRFLGKRARNIAVTAVIASFIAFALLAGWEPLPPVADTLPAFTIIAGENFVNAEWGEPYAVADSGWAGRLLADVAGRSPALAEALQTMRSLSHTDTSIARTRLAEIKTAVDTLMQAHITSLKNDYELYAALTAPQDFELTYSPFPDFSDENPTPRERRFMYDGESLTRWEKAPLYFVPRYYLLRGGGSSEEVLRKQINEFAPSVFETGIYQMGSFGEELLLLTGPMSYRSATILAMSPKVLINTEIFPGGVTDGQLLTEMVYPPRENDLYSISQITASRDSAINYYIAALALDLPASIFWKADGRFVVGYGPQPYLQASDLQKLLNQQEASRSAELNTGSDFIARQRGIVQRRLSAVFGLFTGVLERQPLLEDYRAIAENSDGSIHESAPVYGEGGFFFPALPSDVYRLSLQTPEGEMIKLTEFTVNFIDKTNLNIGMIPWPEQIQSNNAIANTVTSTADLSNLEQNVARRQQATIAQLRSTSIANLSEAILRKRLSQTGLYTSDWSRNNSGYPHELVRIGGNIGDLASGNLWQASPEIRPLTFSSAQAYANQVTAPAESESRTGWRLPTVEEALSICNNRQAGKSGYLPGIFNNPPQSIWTADGAGEGRRWVVDYQTATCRVVAENEYHNVRLVIPADPKYLFKGPTAN